MCHTKEGEQYVVSKKKNDDHVNMKQSLYVNSFLIYLQIVLSSQLYFHFHYVYVYTWIYQPKATTLTCVLV